MDRPAIHRAAKRLEFLNAAGLRGARVEPLAGDASNRVYFRIFDSSGTPTVLMDAPTDGGEDTRPFIRVAKLLLEQGLGAPRILAQDTSNGFLLLEDLGDALFSRQVTRDPSAEMPLYLAAVDVLVRLRPLRPDDLPPYDVEQMADITALAADWYGGSDPARLVRATRDALQGLSPDRCIALRDFHSDNLIWLPDRAGAARVGLLDFQDAMIAHPAYDLVSLIEDSRRDVAPDVHAAALARYAAATGDAADDLARACAVLGAQRQLRILGVFARLSRSYGKPRYLDFLPRVWNLLNRDLAHPALHDLRKVVLADLPAPDQQTLKRLRPA